MGICWKLGLALMLVQAAVSERYHTPPDCPHDHINHDPIYGFIEETDVIDEFECMDLCDSHTECEAYNIELPEFACELNDDVAGPDGMDMVTRDGFTYWEKGDSNDAEPDTCSLNWLGVDGRKQREVTYIENGEHLVNRGGTWAWWGKECKYVDPRVYYVGDYSSRNDLHEYPTENDFKSHTNYIMHYLDPTADGSGQIVWDRRLWYREYNWRRLIAYDIDRDVAVGMINTESMPGANYGSYTSNCQYDWGGRSSVDFESDASGIWFIQGRNTQWCMVSVSKIDPDNFRVVRTWHFDGLHKPWAGTGFIIDNIVYFTDHYNNNPTYILMMYNMRNTTGVYLTPTDGVQNYVKVNQPGGYNSHTHWNEAEQKLYKSHNTQHWRVEPSFRELP